MSFREILKLALVIILGTLALTAFTTLLRAQPVDVVVDSGLTIGTDTVIFTDADGNPLPLDANGNPIWPGADSVGTDTVIAVIPSNPARLDTIRDPLTGKTYVDSLLVGELRNWGGVWTVVDTTINIAGTLVDTSLVVLALKHPPLECDPWLDHQFVNFMEKIERVEKRNRYVEVAYDTLARYHGWVAVDSLKKDNKRLTQENLDLRTQLALTDTAGLISLAAQIDELIIQLNTQQAQLDAQDSTLTVTEDNCQAAWDEIGQHDQLVDALTGNLTFVTAERDSLKIEMALADSLIEEARDIFRQLADFGTIDP